MSIVDQFQSVFKKLHKDISDWTLETLLNCMRLAFEISDTETGNILGLQGYKKNIEEPFNAVYVFCDETQQVDATARFQKGKMMVDTGAAETWDLKVSFKDVRAFWRFIFSGGEDIVGAILANDVQAYGNVNHLHKFGFMAKDLLNRLGIA